MHLQQQTQSITSSGGEPDEPIMANDGARSPKFVRSGQMVQCLRQELLYSEKRPRDVLFESIERLVSEAVESGRPMILSRLIREAASAARSQALRAGLEFANWEMTSRALINAMTRSGALLTHGGCEIGRGITAQATEVVALKENFRDRTEAFLLEFLIRRMADISVRDHTPLAHALFRQFDRDIPMEDLEDRVVLLLARLADRIELREDGTYAARPESVAK